MDVRGKILKKKKKRLPNTLSNVTHTKSLLYFLLLPSQQFFPLCFAHHHSFFPSPPRYLNLTVLHPSPTLPVCSLSLVFLSTRLLSPFCFCLRWVGLSLASSNQPTDPLVSSCLCFLLPLYVFNSFFLCLSMFHVKSRSSSPLICDLGKVF